MIDLYDICNEGQMLCESFKDPRLYQIYRSLWRYKLTFKDIFRYGNTIAWDKIEPSDIEEFEHNDIGKVLKQIRRVKRMNPEERPFILFCMKQEQIQYIYNTAYHEFAEVFNYLGSNSKGFVSWSASGQGRGATSQTEIFSRMEDCDYIIKVYIDEKDIQALQGDRRSSKNGAWFMTKYDHKSEHKAASELGKSGGGISSFTPYDSFYGRCIQEADNAVKRWKKIVAENKFKRDQDTSEVDKAVEDIMIRLPKACMNATKDPDKYDKYDLEDLMKSVYDKHSYSNSGSKIRTTGRDELLALYSKFCMTVMELKTNSSYNAESALKTKDELKESILKKAKNIDLKLKEFGA